MGHRSMKQIAATSVGGVAAARRPRGEMPSSPKLSFRIPKPAGFGALAMTVRPPPVIAPATRAYLELSDKSTSDPKYVSAALSVTAVSAVEPAKSGNSDIPPISGWSHHA